MLMSRLGKKRDGVTAITGTTTKLPIINIFAVVLFRWCYIENYC